MYVYVYVYVCIYIYIYVPLHIEVLPLSECVFYMQHLIFHFIFSFCSFYDFSSSALCLPNVQQTFPSEPHNVRRCEAGRS